MANLDFVSGNLTQTLQNHAAAVCLHGCGLFGATRALPRADDRAGWWTTCAWCWPAYSCRRGLQVGLRCGRSSFQPPGAFFLLEPRKIRGNQAQNCAGKNVFAPIFFIKKYLGHYFQKDAQENLSYTLVGRYFIFQVAYIIGYNHSQYQEENLLLVQMSIKKAPDIANEYS